jgi:prepilin-type N-terminal cleavage/methylation domain-containing protein
MVRQCHRLRNDREGSADFQVCRIAGFPTCGRSETERLPIGKSAIQQVWKPALRRPGAVLVSVIRRLAPLDAARTAQRAIPTPASRRNAFTVIELMVSIAIMGVIIVALYAVFNQTQKAMRSGNVQADVSEKARAVLEMVTRELEQARPTFTGETNMFGGPEYPPQIVAASPPGDPQGRRDIQPRTNYLHNLYFLTHFTNVWQPVAYRVVNVSNHVGSLLRYDPRTNVLLGGRPYNGRLSSNYVREPFNSTNYHHIADGVIHFSVIPYDKNGFRLGWDTTNMVLENYSILRRDIAGAIRTQTSNTTNDNATVFLTGYPGTPPEVADYSTRFVFRSNAMPAYIDLQLGILEPEALSQYNLMLEDDPDDKTGRAKNFLARQISKVHLFRQRIPIRTSAQ